MNDIEFIEYLENKVKQGRIFNRKIEKLNNILRKINETPKLW